MYESYKNILNETQSKNKLKEGFATAAKVVAPTLGAKPKRIFIDKEFGEVEASDDGIDVLNDLEVEDPQENLGIKVIKEAAQKTNDVAGDGTTTTVILTNSLAKEAVTPDDYVAMGTKNNKTDVLKLKKEILDAKSQVFKSVDENTIEVKEDKQILNVARASSNNDDVAAMLLDIFKTLGKDGAVKVTANERNVEISHEIVKGMSYPQGYIHQGFITDGTNETAELDDVPIIVTTDKVHDLAQMQKMATVGEQNQISNLFLICDDLDGVALFSLLKNKLHGNLRVAATKAPGFGNQREYLEDIAVMVGATLIGKEEPVKFADLKFEHFGKAQHVTCEKNNTIITGGEGDKVAITERTKTLKNIFEKENKEYEREKLTERISKLSGGVAVITVGAATENEMKYKKSKIIDAVSSVRAAMESGLVAGGGVALLAAAQKLSDEGGYGVMKRAIQKPFEQILLNANLDVQAIKGGLVGKEVTYGYNVETDEFGDMIEMGVVDPAKVVKTALDNAVSIALSVMSSGGALTLVRKKDEKEDINPEGY